ncbi:MAG TPA: Dam family site-specific DNA-(adenine-N6)-methyltransferase [Acidimicrobiales bacterium]|nr:Dam family site-specific DNA-(adenine-N6)-methyltransferase [Acidimicrobiales bacterium]
MNPLFRWPGGKRWLVPLVRQLATRVDFDTYHEPFAGAAAAFFGIEPVSASLNDLNTELMTAYLAIRDSAGSVACALDGMSFDKRSYYAVRDSTTTSDVETAARFLYLRQAAFGGVYRTNRSGQFNVPYGGLRRTAPLSVDELRKASLMLHRADLQCNTYDDALRAATAHSFVYADPPYAAADVGTSEQFARYTDSRFDWIDQVALAKLLRDLVEQGAFVVASNAEARRVAELYPPTLFHRLRLLRHSCVARSASHRRRVVEILFVSRTICRTPETLRRIVRSWHQ